MKAPLFALALCALAAPAAAQQIALTFDDLPSHATLPMGETRIEIAQKIVAALKEAGTPPVYGFVNGLRLEDDAPSTPLLQMWRDAGFPLGNHTYSHMDLNKHTVTEWEADTLKNEPVLTPLGGDWHWLRYPYLNEGDTIAKHEETRAFLASHGYRVAAVTMSFDDYLWNDPYARCIAKSDTTTIAQMETAWLAAARNQPQLLSRAVAAALRPRHPYVLLMHLGAFDARDAAAPAGAL